MHLRTITLRDWKAYESARFDFPRPKDSKNLVLIGGQNGFGKTTLFEAMSIGLFGRDGLSLVSRAAAASDEQGRSQSFRAFMKRALHGQAIQMGRTSCHIGLSFESEDGRPLQIDRTWNFNDRGELRAGENAESVRIVEGIERNVVGPSATEADPQGWYRDWIARTFLPTHLATFFLFDGEAASVYAERDMGVQIQEGIEGLLGLTWLRKLAEDLRVYAANRRGQVPRGVNTDSVEALEGEICSLQQDLDTAASRIEEIASELQDREQERDSLTRELAGYGTGTRAELEEWIQQRADHEKAYTQAKAELYRIADVDLPLALAGSHLRDKVKRRLEGEVRREQWLAAVNEGRVRVERVTAEIDKELDAVSPPLQASQSVAVSAAVKRALDNLWHPPPDDAADSFRHAHARGPMSDRVQVRLEAAAMLTTGTVSALLKAMAQNAASLRALNARIQSSQVAAPQLDKKRDRIAELNKKIRSLSEEHGEKVNFIRSRKDQLDQKRKELTRLTGQLDQSAKPARLAKRAEEVSTMLDELVGEAWPMQAQSVAKEMTRAIRAMAHRNDYLNRVDISDTGELKLMAPKGRNLRDFDLSAGEKQIFTQALFYAIGKISGRIFPLVIDTPLGRLDEEHRINVLTHLTERAGQVILISTNTEVVGKYLDAVRDRVLKAYRLENRSEGDMATTWPVEGYFPGEGL